MIRSIFNVILHSEKWQSNVLIFLFSLIPISCAKDYEVNYTIKNKFEFRKNTIATTVSGDIDNIITEILQDQENKAIDNFYTITLKNTVLELIKQDFLDLGLYRPYVDCNDSEHLKSICGFKLEKSKPDTIIDAKIEVDKNRKVKIAVQLLDSLRRPLVDKNKIPIAASNEDFTLDSFTEITPNVIKLRKISIDLFKRMNLIDNDEANEILNAKTETSCFRAATEFYKGKKNESFIESFKRQYNNLTGKEKSKLSIFINKYKQKEELEEKTLKRNSYLMEEFLHYVKLEILFEKPFHFILTNSNTNSEVSEDTFEALVKKIDPKENYQKASYYSLKECLGEKTRYLKAEANLMNLSPLLPPIGI